jgi:drug/metabolite transporter (DMT)-like permease
MSGESAADTTGGPNPGVVVGGVFAAIVTLTVVAYAVTVSAVNLLAVDLLAYPVAGVAPFVVITGAILTIPIMIPTALVSMKRLE